MVVNYGGKQLEDYFKWYKVKFGICWAKYLLSETCNITVTLNSYFSHLTRITYVVQVSHVKVLMQDVFIIHSNLRSSRRNEVVMNNLDSLRV